MLPVTRKSTHAERTTTHGTDLYRPARSSTTGTPERHLTDFGQPAHRGVCLVDRKRPNLSKPALRAVLVSTQTGQRAKPLACRGGSTVAGSPPNEPKANRWHEHSVAGNPPCTPILAGSPNDHGC
ncbi:hypothetical protein [Spirosoma pollinicola]|uniref:hypothetical protein n=1 Tax=Spirosoma pollinicola TaxID=2057025 RepID=UPI0012FD7388|nr:hypothetical protein [Spirosoma pollinicola]